MRREALLIAGARRDRISLRPGNVTEVHERGGCVGLVPQSTPECERFLVVSPRGHQVSLLVGGDSEARKSARRGAAYLPGFQSSAYRQRLLVESAGALALPLSASHVAQVGQRGGDAGPVLQLLSYGQCLLVALARCFVIRLSPFQNARSTQRLRAFPRALLSPRMLQSGARALQTLAEVRAYLPK